MSLTSSWRKHVLGSGNSKYTGPEERTCVGFLRH